MFAIIYLALIGFVLLFTLNNANREGRKSRDLKKQGFHVQYISNKEEFWIVYHENEGKIVFVGTRSPQDKEILDVLSPNLWKSKMPVWANSRRSEILERIRKARRFIVVGE